ncbi:flagellin [Oceanobacillus rekensis]|uniref:flagellin N-terminal helical domain-containing protein n=1 Tax=Oceanobacillus rekensis TaxID=937927 RepID=UPI000B448249|nr:flagellin [Oceanobacillus rekensis]
MIINHNISAINAHRQLGANQSATQNSLEKLSSGLGINKAGDDAAGLAISEKMRGQIQGLEQAQSNAQDGISLIQTAEGAMNESHAILQRMRELAVQSSNDTNTDTDRAELQKEVDQLANALTDISENTEFNTKNLLNGEFEGTFHVGANEGQNLSVEINDMSASALNVGGVEGASYAIASTAGAGLTNDTTYNVTKLDEGSTVRNNANSADVAVNYALQDDSGDIVAVSADGKDYQTLSASSSKEDLATATQSTDAAYAFADAVVSGSVEVNGSGVANATATATTGVDLADGTYTVVGTEHAAISTGNGLLNDKGDLVATSDDGQDWKSYSDANKTVLTTGTALQTAGAEITVGSGEGLNISTQKSADAAITTIQSAIDTVSAERSKLGAVQNRLDHTINNLGTSAENLTAAESRIRDVDMAKEMMEFTKNNILSQAAQSMLAQAQQMPQGVLQLLQ